MLTRKKNQAILISHKTVQSAPKQKPPFLTPTASNNFHTVPQ